MWQDKYSKDCDIHQHSIHFLAGSTVAMQMEDDGLWTHGVIVEGNSEDHNEQTYKVRVTKTGRLITHNTRHLQKTPVATEQYLRQQTAKGNGHQEDIHGHKLT